MTHTELKTLAEEAKRFDGGDWYLFQHLTTDWSMGKQDAAYIAAVSPDVVLGLLAERDALRADAELGRVAMRFVDRAGDVHPGIDDAETICADFYKAMWKALDMKRGEA